MISKIKNIYCGKKQIINDGKRREYQSSYKKLALNKPEYFVDKNGFIDDTQSDKENHGGIDKAICAYSQKYYDFFKSEHSLNLPNCAFGENLTILDLDDSEICLGDKFEYGETILEVSQPRQPCWKISSIIGIKNLTGLVTKEQKTGFYFRVLKEGKVFENSQLKLISRDFPKLTIEYINQCAFNAKNNQENIKEILECEKLAEDYRISLERRYKNREAGLQDWQKDDY
jgi:MOSC domain-containing protein YiiM